MTIFPPRDWTEIRWPDIGKADAARWIAVLPLAATEQHGPHLPLETDVLIGEAYLALDDMAKAKEHLAALDRLCFFPCSQYRDLKRAIEAYEKSGGKIKPTAAR